MTLIAPFVCSCTGTEAGAWRCFWRWRCRGRSRPGWWCCWCSRASSRWSTGRLGCRWSRRCWSAPSRCTASTSPQKQPGWPWWCASPSSPWRRCPSSSTSPQQSALLPGKSEEEEMFYWLLLKVHFVKNVHAVYPPATVDTVSLLARLAMQVARLPWECWCLQR